MGTGRGMGKEWELVGGQVGEKLQGHIGGRESI